MAELSRLKRYINKLPDNELADIFGSYISRMHETKKIINEKSGVLWFDKNIIGLNNDGLARLEELEKQQKSNSGRHVNERQLRYLRALKMMSMKVPDSFRDEINPKKLFVELHDFCIDNNIPEEILNRLVPSVITYIETGHIRPMILVGEKGCGKTTALRMLLEKALKIPSEVVKIPQLDGGHGMTGDCDTFQAADAGVIAKARLNNNSLLVAYIFDEIDKVPHFTNRSNIDDELLSITDESNNSIYDNFLETTIVGLEYCPMFFTANDLNKINPILADRCSIITFPSASATRIKKICQGFVMNKIDSRLFKDVDFDYELMFKTIDKMVEGNVTSIRKHQQMIEAVLDKALNELFTGNNNCRIKTSEKMFKEAMNAVMGTEKHKIGFN